jgi:hypothetical protein
VRSIFAELGAPSIPSSFQYQKYMKFLMKTENWLTIDMKKELKDSSMNLSGILKHSKNKEQKVLLIILKATFPSYVFNSALPNSTEKSLHLYQNYAVLC